MMTPSILLPPCADRRRSVAAIVAVAVAAALGSQPARASDDKSSPTTAPTADPEARRLAEQGLAHFEAGRYDEAIRDLEASYQITPAPGFLYNLAQAHRLRGDCAAAVGSYRRFLSEDPSGVIRQRAEARIAEMERCVAAARPARAAPEVTLVSPPSLVPVPARPAAPAAIVGPSLSHGRVDLVMPGPAAPAARSESRWRRPLTIGLGGVVVALAGGSAYFASRADQASDDVSRVYDFGGVWGSYAMSREQDGQRATRWALALGAGAAISAALAVWMAVRR